jgi:hypothetical protein
MAKSKSSALIFLNAALAAAETQVDSVIASLNMCKAVMQNVTNKDSFIKGEEQGLSSPQINKDVSKISKAQTFSESEKLAMQGSLYGQADQVIEPGCHINNVANVLHPCVINFPIPVDGSAPRDGYLMLYTGQDFRHANIMCCQGLVPAAMTKHCIVKKPQATDTNMDAFPQQLSTPWIVKISNSTEPSSIKYLIFYTAENQDIDGSRQNYSKIYMSTWTGELDVYSGQMLGLTHKTAAPIIDNTQSVQQVCAPYVEVDMDSGSVHIWFAGVDASSNTSAIFYVSTTLVNILSTTTSLAIPAIPFLSLQREPGLLSLNESIKRRDGRNFELSGHIISFRGVLVSDMVSSGTGIATTYRYFWLSVEAVSDMEPEYITLFGKSSVGVTEENYNPDVYIEGVAGDVNDFPTATKRCFFPTVTKRTITQPDSIVNSTDLFDIWWSTGSISKNYIAYSGCKVYTARTWIDSPASTVFNEALAFASILAKTSEETKIETINVFSLATIDSSASLSPLRLPVSLIGISGDTAAITFDIDKLIQFTTEIAINAPDDSVAITSNVFDTSTGRENINAPTYIDDYTCKDGDTLDAIAAYYYNNKIDTRIPYGPLQFSGLISDVNNICDADIYAGLKIKIPDPGAFNVRA